MRTPTLGLLLLLVSVEACAPARTDHLELTGRAELRGEAVGAPSSLDREGERWTFT